MGAQLLRPEQAGPGRTRVPDGHVERSASRQRGDFGLSTEALTEGGNDYTYTYHL